MKNIVIGIVGSRRRDTEEDFNIVKEKFFEIYSDGDKICSGLCPHGADRFALIISDRYNITPIWFPAEWEKYGKNAGKRRNTDIAKTSDILIACVAPDRKGGTEDTIKKFEKFHKRKSIIV